MSHALRDDAPVTIAEFDAFLEHQIDSRGWELVDGEILGMTNPSAAHEQIVSNIGYRLKPVADARGCQVFFGGMRIQRSASTAAIDKPKPDLLVRCGSLPDAHFVTDPLIVAEVLSPSTMDFDRGAKLAFYKRLPTVAHIVLVYQDEMRVEHYRRENSAWTHETLTAAGSHVALEALGAGFALAEAYFGVFEDSAGTPIVRPG
jgi:Uma2 family endonuclease